MNRSKIFAIVGKSGSGKTTLIVKLIGYFKSRGYSISVVKNMHHDFDFDYPGKDSYRFKEAGADSVAATNGEKLGIVADLSGGCDAMCVAERYFSTSDIVIIEGNKKYSTEKIEVIGDSPEKPLFQAGVENIRLIVTDKKIVSDLPVFRRDDVENIGGWIEKNLLA